MPRLLLLAISSFFLCLNALHASQPVTTNAWAMQGESEGEYLLWVELAMGHDPAGTPWHVYWENPGELGQPTQLIWDAPNTNFLGWPTPKRFESFDIIGYGYENTLLLGTKLQNASPNDLITGTISWLACADACIPGEATLSINLASAKPYDPQFLQNFQNALPASFPDWSAESHAQSNTLELTVTYIGSAHLSKIDQLYYFDPSDRVDSTAPQSWQSTATGYAANIPLNPSADLSLPFTGVIRSQSSWAPNRHGLLLDERTPAASSTFNSLALPQALLFAFIGGLILNLMPCVFPVIGLKMMSFVRQAGEDSSKLKFHGLFFALGILISFWLLSGALLGLRASGELIGWGFQLQSPGFVLFLIALMFTIGLNFAGIFEFGTSWTGVGQGLRLSGFTDSFASGVLATLVATPCTAPFMGAALGYALALPPLQSMAIFTALALGLAIPYVILSFFPSLLKILPKPGAWMESFKKLMAFPMFATAVWLIWVFGQQLGIDSVARILFALILLSLALWVYGRWCMLASFRKRLGSWLWITLFAAASLYSFITSLQKEDTLNWQPYSPELITSLEASGQPIYLDFTAAWCLTCQANKRIVFSSDAVKQRLRDLNVTLVRGDWTNHDPQITKAIESFGRSGVPVNVIYTGVPGKAPILLPELLTPDIVLEALDQVRKP